MIEKEIHSTLIAAIDKFGVDGQVRKLQEELLELALVLNQINCPTKNRSKMEENLYSELADVKIMMIQAELISISTMLLNL